MLVKKNIFSNLFGQVYIAFLGVVFLPYFLNKLGPESFSLIGIYSLLQAWLHLLDSGTTASIGRESAKYLGGGHSSSSIVKLVKSVEFFSVLISILIVLIISIFSKFISYNWLNSQDLHPEKIRNCLLIMGFVIAFRLIEGIYKSFLNGLQKQFELNICNCFNASLRWFGAAFFISIGYRDPIYFFFWQLISSIVSFINLGFLSYKYLPLNKKNYFSFSLRPIYKIRAFAVGMIFVNFLGLIIGQVDKLILSKLISLNQFGYYTLASSIASGLFFLVTAINNAYYPLFCKFKQENNMKLFTDIFHKSAKLNTLITGSFSIYLLLFTKEFLRIWIRDPNTVLSIELVLKLIIIGNLLNTFCWIPFHCQLAYGWTSLSNRTNSFLCVIIPILMYYMVLNFGFNGAAISWIAVNCLYIIIFYIYMFNKIFKSERNKWIINDIFKPILIIFIITSFLKILFPANSSLLIQNLYVFISPIIILGFSLKRFKLLNFNL